MQKYEKSIPEGDTFAQTRKITFGRFLHFTLLLSLFHQNKIGRKEVRYTNCTKCGLKVLECYKYYRIFRRIGVFHKFARVYCLLKVIR